MIAANTTLTFAVDGQVSLSWTDWQRTPADLRSIVLDQLTPYLGVSVVNVQPLDSGLLDWTYSALVTVTTKSAYATTDDVASIVAHAFYVGGNNLPTVNVTAEQAAPTPGGIGDYTTWIGSVGAEAKRIVDALPMMAIVIGIAAIVLGVVVLKADA